MVKNEAVTGDISQHQQQENDENAQLMDSEDVTEVSGSIDITALSTRVTSENATLVESHTEDCTSCQTTPRSDSTRNTAECNTAELEKNVPHGEISEVATSDATELLPARRSVAIQTDAYDSDDDSSDEETSSADADSDTSSVCSGDSSTVRSSVCSPIVVDDHCVDNNIDHDDEEDVKNATSQPVVFCSNTSDSATSERVTERTSTCAEIRASSNSSGNSAVDKSCSSDMSAKPTPSPIGLQSREQNGQEICSNGPGPDSETAVVEPGPTSIVEDASQHDIASPRMTSQPCNVTDCSSATTGCRNSSVAFCLSDASPGERTAMSLDADQMSSSFKMPGCSPEDVGRFTSETYQSSCAAYSSPQSNYGGVSSDCSPPSCVQLPQNGSQNSLGGIGNYSMPTPSPTNSSARSFNMASPGSYQQLASVTQLEQSGTPSCYQMEPGGYQPPTSLPTSVASYQRPSVENYPQSLPAHQQTVTPPMERVNSHWAGGPGADYMGASVQLQHHPGYHVSGTGSSCMPSQMMGSWSSLYMQQQQQQSAIKPVEFVSQHSHQRHHAVPQNISQTGFRSSSSSSSLSCRSNTDKQRRYGSKNCGKNVAASHSLMRNAQKAAPNVAVHPGTNMITGYDVYGPNIAECAGNPRGGGGGGSQMPPGLDYHSLHHGPAAALGYHGSYVSDHPHVGVPANIYHYQQQPAGGYSATAQSNYVHGQTVCPSTVAYGYMNQTLIGRNTFDMNAMRH